MSERFLLLKKEKGNSKHPILVKFCHRRKDYPFVTERDGGPAGGETRQVDLLRPIRGGNCPPLVLFSYIGVSKGRGSRAEENQGANILGKEASRHGKRKCQRASPA